MLPPPPSLDPARHSLFLDFDGTLVELAERPDTIRVEDTLRDLLTALSETLGGRVALVSGRSVAQIDGFLHPARVAAIAGSHGGECRYPGGRLELPEGTEAFASAAAEARRFAENRPGLIVEAKSFGVALHYRLAPELEDEVLAFAKTLAGRHGFVLQPGKFMIDMHMPGEGKGGAVARLMAEPPMAGTEPLFVGDDLTDEGGFAAAARHGGAGVLVGPPRDTAAAYALPDVSAVLAWLAAGLGR